MTVRVKRVYERPATEDGRRILVEGPTALSSVLAMVEGLAQ